MRKSLFTRIVILALVFILCLQATAFGANPQEEFQQTEEKLAELEEEQLRQQQLIQQLQAETEALQTEYETICAAVEAYEAPISYYDEQINALDQEIMLTRMDYDDEFSMYAMYVRNIEEYGTTTYWEILLGSASIADFLARLDYIYELMSYEENILAEFEETLASLEEKSEQLNSLRADRNYIAVQLRSQQEYLHDNIEEHLAKVVELETLTAEYAAQIEDLTAKKEELRRILAGYVYTGTSDPDELYEKYIVQTGVERNYPEAAAIVKMTLSYLGYDYVWGGANPKIGFDCSGLMYYVYKQFGYTLNRVACDQWSGNGKYVSFESLRAGDLIYFANSKDDREVGHTGMYLGGGLFIHAAGREYGVIVSNLYDAGLQARYVGAKRIA